MVVGDGTLLTAGYTPHVPHQQQPLIENLPPQPGPSQVYYQNNNSVPAWYSNANNSTLHPTFQSQAQHSRLPAQNYDTPGIQREPAPPIRQPYYYPARPVNPAPFRTPQPYAPGPRQQSMVDYRIPGAGSYQQNSMHHFGPPPTQAYPGHQGVMQPSGATAVSPLFSQQPTYQQPTYQQGTLTSSYPSCHQHQPRHSIQVEFCPQYHLMLAVQVQHHPSVSVLIHLHSVVQLLQQTTTK